MKVILPLRAYKALSRIVSKDETRYTLNGIFIEAHQNGTTTATATDGRRLLVIDITSEQGEIPKREANAGSMIFPLIPIATFTGKFPAKRENSLLLLQSDENPYSCEVTPWFRETPCVTIKLIEGVFPDIRNIIKMAIEAKPEQFTCLNLNPELLSELFKAISDYSPKNGITITATGRGDSNGAPMDPYLLKSNGSQNIFGILMPMRAERGTQVPGFLSKMTEPQTPKPTDGVPKAANG